MAQARLKVYGWGRKGEGMTPDEESFVMGGYRRMFGVRDFPDHKIPTLEEYDLRAPRLTPPAALARICSTDRYERALHAHSKGYTDYVRIMLNRFASAPDVVAYPETEQDIAAVMAWADGAGAVVIPFGGGSSVCGGVTPPADGPAVVTLNLSRLDKVLEIDRTSRAARIQAGVFGPALENQLRPHKLTLRHFPQSFEYSTLGGWIATRSGGHFATLYTHIDDLVESLRVVTPAGTLESRRLPGSGAGPSPDRMFIGSEGILGVITEAWMRLQDRPTFRAGGAVRFKDFFAAARALRVLSQAGLYPSNCRILDPNEARNTGAADGSAAIMVLAFESADHPVDAWMARALEIVRDHGGVPETEGGPDAHREGAAGQWRNAFIRMPYAREFLTPRAIINDTFETAITWDRFEAFHDSIKQATEKAIRDVTGKPGFVTCRFTHVYPDGPAPYFSFHGQGRHGAMLEQWQAIKTAASDAVIAGGGTITHHHAVGREHRPWYDRQRPDLFAAALKAAKKTLDPRGMMNPGVLIDP
ncbi:FAD-binding oxidoreductase [Rhodopila sp.]|jgi:alkyldihydroxyacetonephosphate synthase|uniref:FAD-binding oxidoreductase n=1 Tax=Rhodopila sp. TaxID=2480087 RepID=UPI002C2E6407|nr:FAD-binding oxidoreductase [Rhodopila sp.]HVZ08327.1 FAD-binding oxidoreductase [Rhodopila sp.]